MNVNVFLSGRVFSYKFNDKIIYDDTRAFEDMIIHRSLNVNAINAIFEEAQKESTEHADGHDITIKIHFNEIMKIYTKSVQLDKYVSDEYAADGFNDDFFEKDMYRMMGSVHVSLKEKGFNEFVMS